MDITELKLNDNEFNRIRKIVYETVGIKLGDNKCALIVSRLARRLRQLQMQSFSDYIRLLGTDNDEVLLLINKITTNLTRFYREDNQFKILREKVLPQIMMDKKRRRENYLRIWSAGCSTGEEVYTILFEVTQYLRGKVGKNFDLKILGSDIDTVVLKKATSGIYTREEIANVGQSTLEHYFDTLSSAQYRIKERWRKLVLFKRINLAYDNFRFKRKVDIIFCRNVVIYFDKPTRDRLYKKFYTVLNDPGYFFSGHSENLFKYNQVFKFMEKSVYKKVV